MSATPRLRSSYPSTPDRTPKYSGGRSGERVAKAPLPSIPSTPLSKAGVQNTPVIPLTLIDAPTQRFYVAAVYLGLLAWRLYDWGRLVEDDTESLWLFLKWVAIDGIFLYGLPSLRIPWLEWANPLISGIFMFHGILNGMLMFRIPIPLQTWLLALSKTLYDRELSISENSVKPASILHNSSLIMGRQIINILPEGSAILNPDRKPFCIDKQHPSVILPIRFNQTDPILIEVVRIDLDTNFNETLLIRNNGRNTKALKSRSKGPEGVLVMDYVAKKPGLYRLQKVIDKTSMEVQRRASDTLVVDCPSAVVKPAPADKCTGDLSDLTLVVRGVPPLKIKYSRTINRKDQSFHFQSIQPENFVSPLLGTPKTTAVVSHGDEDMSWARSHSVDVRLNESLATVGDWLYSVDEIHDATGNVANFSARGEDGEHIYPRGTHLEHRFKIHGRPLLSLERCSMESPINLAMGRSTSLPLKFESLGGTSRDQHTVTYQFSSIDKLSASGEHGDESITLQDTLAFNAAPTIRDPGLYTLIGVETEHCKGEVQEPTSCLLLNPPKPELQISSEHIHDKCAGNSIGLLVDLDLIGMPPFKIEYVETHNRDSITHVLQVDSLRHQIELKPRDAGHFKYRFKSLQDAYYNDISLTGSDMVLEQNVKPPAFAQLLNTRNYVSACINEPVQFDVHLQGESPFTLEYELVHEGKRSKQRIPDIAAEYYSFLTENLDHGGEYILSLSSVQDATGCKIFLNHEVLIDVRRQRPKASFGQIDGKRSVMALEGRNIDLPVRLLGEPNWTLKYRNLNDPSGKVQIISTKSTNALLNVKDRGVYEIMEVMDQKCPGSVDPVASTFEVNWVARPDIKVAESSVLIHDGNRRYVKHDVCEADVDVVELSLSGSPPFHLKYGQRHKPSQGSRSISNKEIDAALGIATISMDTSKAGQYVYEFSELSDGSYDHDHREHKPLVIEQTVNPKPSARFLKPGQIYRYCKEEEAGAEVIPIGLTGQPPFSIEVDIKHQSSTRPETVKIPHIDSNTYNFKIPHRVLSLGTHQVSVRKVVDAKGCQKKTEYDAPHVQVQVFDVPTIYPLDSRTDYCVGDRIAYTLSGTAPFEVYYNFESVERKAKSPDTSFRRIAEKPGEFRITAISDKASECKASVDITKVIHQMPSVRISKGRDEMTDIHEGDEAPILFEFWGTPPFEFTYTRSTNAKRGQKSVVLETKHDISYEFSKTVRASQEGTYEVVAIKDKHCAFSTLKADTKSGQKLLQY